MAFDIFTARLFDETYRLRFDPAQATCQIERDTSYEDEGGWESTGKQVADYGHSPRDAMRDELEQTIEQGGDHPEDYETYIVVALYTMTRETAN